MRAGGLGDFAGGFFEEFVDEGLVGFGLLAAMRRSWRSSCGAMRMAMSCFAFPEAGRPTLGARRSSAAVDSGMSERSSLQSGIGLALFAGRLARADDANDFLGIVHLGRRVAFKDAAFVANSRHLASKRRLPQSLEGVRGANERDHARAKARLVELDADISGNEESLVRIPFESTSGVAPVVRGGDGLQDGDCSRDV